MPDFVGTCDTFVLEYICLYAADPAVSVLRYSPLVRVSRVTSRVVVRESCGVVAILARCSHTGLTAVCAMLIVHCAKSGSFGPRSVVRNTGRPLPWSLLRSLPSQLASEPLPAAAARRKKTKPSDAAANASV